MFEGCVSGDMGRLFGIKITDDADGDRVCHYTPINLSEVITGRHIHLYCHSRESGNPPINMDSVSSTE
jgi:hypothetical protein